MTVQSSSSPAGIKRGLIVAGLLILAAGVLQLLSPGYLSRDVELRILGILSGAVVLIYANLVPKALTPRMSVCGDPIVEQSIRRFTGWTLALGGVAYAVVWMIAPIHYATALSVSVLAGAALLVVIRIALVTIGSRT